IRPVERDDVRAVRFQEHAISGDGDSAVDSAGRIADDTARARTLVMPDRAAAARVERIDLIGACDVHDAIDDDWRDFQMSGAGEGEAPFRPEPFTFAGVIWESVV